MLEVNKRDAIKGMVEDAHWHQQSQDYQAFLQQYATQKVLFLEIGVGMTTPQFIRHPFQEMTGVNPRALYVTMNQKPYAIPKSITHQTVRITDDIAETLRLIASRG